VLALIVSGSVVASAAGGDAIKTLLITGQNNHNWQFTSRVHEETLEATGRFDVDVTDNPASTLADGAGLGQYKLFVLDYNGERWGSGAEANFAAAVKAGTGVVVIHASNNAFVGWTDYERVCGLMWVNGTTGHGAFHPFDVTFVDHEHPITKGLADFKSHPDELYHKLVNTQSTPFTLLAQALSSSESRGTGKDEPMAVTLAFGKGRVFHTPLGHVWTGDDVSKASIVDPQFKTLLTRGAEWAATGNVTLGSSWKDVREHNTLTAQRRLRDGSFSSMARAARVGTDSRPRASRPRTGRSRMACLSGRREQRARTS
jgi:type 1 glutamine amidotransferase